MMSFDREEVCYSLLEGLNPAQQEAVQHKDGPLLVLAGPGSGKTRVVTHRVAWLLCQNVPSYQILALTFTNKAADEMKNRLEILAPGNRVWVGTFHRFCSFLLRSNAELTGLSQNFTIYDADQSQLLLGSLVDKKDLPTGIDLAAISTAISWAKNNMILPDDYKAKEGHLLGQIVEQVYPEYQHALNEANAVDFDDLLLRIAVLVRTQPEIRGQWDARFRYILVDEYQDTNLIQYAIVRALSVDYPNLAVTGDPDQSIYAWRGANIHNILNFEKDFPNVHTVRLEQNYRSSKNILAVASDLIKHNRFRKEKDLFTENEEGTRPRVLCCFNHYDEAETIASEIAYEISTGKRSPKDYAIFYRMNALSRNLEHALRRHGVPFQLIRGLEFFRRKEIKDVLAYLQLIYNPNDTVAFRRIINFPVRGIGRVSLNRLEAYAAQKNISLFEATSLAEKIPQINVKTKKSFLRFYQWMSRLGEMSSDVDLEVLVSMILDETQFLAGFKNSDSEDNKQRLANVQELLSEVREFDSAFNEELKQNEQKKTFQTDFWREQPERLARFLEQTALVSDIDDWDTQINRVSLMTLHASKGLEFPVVYIIALEDNILPHERSSDDKMQLEEERRLLFVGITRAKEEIRLSRTQFREYRGSYSGSISSRFLFEFPKNKTQFVNSLDEIASENASDSGQCYLSNFLDAQEEKFSASGAISSNRKTSASVPDEYAQEEYEELEEYRREDDLLSDSTTTERNESSRDEPATFSISQDDVEQDAIFDNADLGGEIEVEVVYEDGQIPEKPMKKKNLPQILPSALTIGAALSNLSSQKHLSDSKSQPIKINSFVRHKNYGIGIVKAIQGPMGAKIVTVNFFSAIGTVDLPMDEGGLTVIASQSSRGES